MIAYENITISTQITALFRAQVALLVQAQEKALDIYLYQATIINAAHTRSHSSLKNLIINTR